MHTEQEILDNIKIGIDSWQNVSLDKLKFTRQTGFTNITHKVSFKEENENKINKLIYRQFSQNCVFINRRDERIIYDLMADKGLGPKALYQTDIYRMEEFIIGDHPSLEETNSKLFRKIMAYKIAQVHQLQPTEINKTPCLIKCLKRENPIVQAYLTEATKIVKSNKTQKDLVEEITSQLTVAFDLIPKITEKNIIFCHNDLNNLNIFKLPTNSSSSLIPELMFIDYEYSGYNFKAFDFANYFNEQTFNYNYSQDPFYVQNLQDFPTREEIENITTYYLYFYYCLQNNRDNKIEEVINNQEKLEELFKQYFNNINLKEERDQMVKEIYICAMLSHYYWTLWSIINATTEDIDFNYFFYAKQRFETYKNLKKFIEETF